MTSDRFELALGSLIVKFKEPPKQSDIHRITTAFAELTHSHFTKEMASYFRRPKFDIIRCSIFHLTYIGDFVTLMNVFSI